MMKKDEKHAREFLATRNERAVMSRCTECGEPLKKMAGLSTGHSPTCTVASD